MEAYTLCVCCHQHPGWTIYHGDTHTLARPYIMVTPPPWPNHILWCHPHIPLLVLMTLFLYLLCQPCFHPCLRSLPLVYFIDLVPFLFPPCSISKCLLITVYTPSCLVSYKYPSTSPCISSLKSTKSLLPIPGPCSLCPTGTYARGQHLTSVIVPNQSPVLPKLFPA